jgi:hypothetical protein
MKITPEFLQLASLIIAPAAARRDLAFSISDLESGFIDAGFENSGQALT